MNDDKLLALVAGALGDGPPPPAAVEGAYAAYGWRTLETDLALAALVDDSQPEVVGFHQGGPEVHRLLTFQTPQGTVEVAIGADHCEVTVLPRPERVTIVGPDPSRPALELAPGVDGGAAVVAGLRGPARVEVTWPGGSSATPWFTL